MRGKGAWVRVWPRLESPVRVGGVVRMEPCLESPVRGHWNASVLNSEFQSKNYTVMRRGDLKEDTHRGMSLTLAHN